MSFDTVIRDGRWFDGTGAPSAIRNIGIRDGHVAAITAEPLDETGCPQVIDAAGKWVLPGLIDIHTHYDVEILVAPALSESVRHGVTTVLVGSCSLSTIHVDGQDAGDIFGRVEAIPRKYVVDTIDELKDWSSCAGYITSLEKLPLGPNVTAFIGHSDMRAATMGLDRATRADVSPTTAEQDRMEAMLDEALEQGFVGMSSQQLLFDKLDGEVCRSRTLPSTYAKAKELRRLKSKLRRSGRILQAGPDVKNPLDIVSQLAQALGIFRRPLKTSLLAAADVKANPVAVPLMIKAARALNKLGADFRWQHLPVPFEVYADGIDLVIFEEFGSGAEALHLREYVERDELMRDEDYRRRFRKDYANKYGPRVWHRDFFDAEIVDCPDASVIGKSFGQVGVDRGGVHPVDAFLDLVLEHGTALRWHTTISNHRPEMLRKIAQEPGIQMGFSDAGAHLRNMAFYNMGLRLLRHVVEAERAGTPFLSVEQAVHRLTGELADWYRIDAGHLRVGNRADILVLDPDHLDATLDAYAEESFEPYGGLSRMVNRNDDAVTAVFISGRNVIRDGRPTEVLGTQRTGSFLRVDTRTPAVDAQAKVPVPGAQTGT
ncbi:N-acyl-D-amino-acid deacylase family protein [[Mycobacterium] zoologicum]|uniref:N-acyl-D-amino-acid deacylase family protein n=1 Tax=[Mycobacterium] zoologicum TaxID=2872311 RepID=UPI001CDB45CE|nr:amidohydrolase family protein [Mycolicibacter sp. MYC101]MEB3061471.1 amidohydrolase family protein [Mycolicibacter sp. MYC101]